MNSKRMGYHIIIFIFSNMNKKLLTTNGVDKYSCIEIPKKKRSLMDKVIKHMTYGLHTYNILY